MRRRTLLGLGASFIGAGAIYQTGAFDTIAGERGATISSAEDPNAFFGLDGHLDPAPVPTFTNGFTNEIEVTLNSGGPNVEFDIDNNDAWSSVPVNFFVQPGETREVQVNAGASAIEVDIDVTEYQSNTAVGSVSMSRTFAVPQALQVDISGTVKSAGASGRYEFGLINVGEIEATLVGMGVIETSNPDAEKVGGRAGDDVLVWDNENEQLLFEEMIVDSTTEDVEIYELDTPIPFPPENNGAVEQIFEFDRFRHADNANADMRGADVRVFLEFEDSSTTVRLVADE